MRVIVTGGSGQVGLKLQEIAKNNKDISFFFPSSKNFDLRNKDSIAANIEEFNPNTIVNLAAYTAVDNAEKEKKFSDLIENNPEYIIQKSVKGMLPKNKLEIGRAHV